MLGIFVGKAAIAHRYGGHRRRRLPFGGEIAPRATELKQKEYQDFYIDPAVNGKLDALP